MALETVVFSQDPFGYGFKDFYSLLGGPGGANWGYDFCLQQQQEDQESLEEDKSLIGIFDNRIMDRTVHANWDYSSSPPSVPHNINNELGIMSDPNSSPEACTVDQSYSPPVSAVAAVAEQAPSTATVGRRKRRRTRSSKNKEELENQRMTHIAVERNRRKQMNEYLAILRSLMPPSYVQRGDQASIVGGAINFVKELEQFLQSMESQHKRTKKQDKDEDGFSSPVSSPSLSPLAEFFTFPQYSTRATAQNPSTENRDSSVNNNNNSNRWAAADIEVTMVDSHANLKILSKKRPRLLLKMVASLQALRFSILHLNVTTVDHMVLYSVSVKIEEGCQLNTVDEIAAAVNQMLGRIQEEPSFT